jgi:hypothetical protein
MKSTSLTTIAALLVFGIGGFMAGRISSPAGSEDQRNEEGIAAARAGGSGSQGGGDSAEATRRSLRAERPERVIRKTGDEAQADRKTRLEEIVRGENALERNRALLAFIDQLGPGDFEEAVAHFRSLGITDGRFSEYAMLLTAWSQADPLAALDYAKANTRGGFATGTILSAWATTDPEAAIR